MYSLPTALRKAFSRAQSCSEPPRLSKWDPGISVIGIPWKRGFSRAPLSTCWIRVCIFTASLDLWAHSVWGAPLKPALCFGFAWIQLPTPGTCQLYLQLVLKSRLPFNHSLRMHCLGGHAYRELNVLHQSVSYFRVEDRRESITPTLENPSHKS